MPDMDAVRTAVLQAVETYNLGQAEEHRLAANWDATLLGPGGGLDSLGLVTLVVAVEQRLAQDFGVAVTLADEKALSQKNSPFRTLQALAEYAATQVQAAADA